MVVDDAQVNLVLMSALLGKLPDVEATFSFRRPKHWNTACSKTPIW